MAPAVRLALLALVACVALHAVSAAPAVEDDELDVFDDEPAVPPTPPAAAKPATKAATKPAKAAKAATDAAAGATEDGAAKKDGKKDAKEEPVLPPTPQYQVQRFCIATIIFQMIGAGCYMTNKYGDRVMKGGKTEIKKVYTERMFKDMMNLQSSNTKWSGLMCLCLWYHTYYRGGSIPSALLALISNIIFGVIVFLRGADADSENPLHIRVGKVRWFALAWLVYEMGNVPGVVY